MTVHALSLIINALRIQEFVDMGLYFYWMLLKNKTFAC